jgi:hypothetical protein
MQTRPLATALLAVSIALGTVAVPAYAQTRQDQDGIQVKRQHSKKPTARSTTGVGTKIACPKGGCRLIPANCGVTMEETWEGPTGNELIACP